MLFRKNTIKFIKKIIFPVHFDVKLEYKIKHLNTHFNIKCTLIINVIDFILLIINSSKYLLALHENTRMKS